MHINDIPLSKAYDLWKRSYKFDKHVYEVMTYIVQKENPRVLINRNPTLNYYSILLMRIRHIKKDDTDFTMSVPLSILPGLNADQPSRSGYMVTYNDQLCERLTSGVNTFVFANGRSYIRLVWGGCQTSRRLEYAS